MILMPALTVLLLWPAHWLSIMKVRNQWSETWDHVVAGLSYAAFSGPAYLSGYFLVV